ncbi:MAG: hypothetical protein ACKOW3_08540 [Hyphomicrobium sp.]
MFDFSSLTDMLSQCKKGSLSKSSALERDFIKTFETTGLDQSGFVSLSRNDITTLLSNYGIDSLNFLGGRSDELVNTIRMTE